MTVSGMPKDAWTFRLTRTCIRVGSLLLEPWSDDQRPVAHGEARQEAVAVGVSLIGLGAPSTSTQAVPVSSRRLTRISRLLSYWLNATYGTPSIELRLDSRRTRRSAARRR